MAPPVHQVRTRAGRSFLVEHGGVLTMVDTGAAGSMGRLRRALVRIGRPPEHVRQIVLTHCHGDHAGEAGALRDLTGAPVLAGAGDAGVIEGRDPYPGPKVLWGRIGYGWLKGFPRTGVDTAIAERTELEGGLVAIPAPGHTPGHLAVWAPDHRALMVGDAVWNLMGLRPSWKGFTWDRERNRETVAELSDLPAESLWFGHGGPVARGGRHRLRSLARG